MNAVDFYLLLVLGWMVTLMLIGLPSLIRERKRWKAVRSSKILLILTILVSSDASAGGWNPLLPAPAKPVGVGSGGANVAPVVLLSAPFTTVGGTFASDASTVSNVTWNGSTIVDPYNTWTQNGTVPQVTTSPWYPQGFSAAPMAGAGAFSDANYYSLGSGVDVLDFTGDFSCCLVFNPSVVDATQRVLVTTGPDSAAGWNVDQTALGLNVPIIFSTTGARSLVGVSNAPSASAINMSCFGRAGATGYNKLNLSTLATGAAGAITPGTAYVSKIGRDNLVTGFSASVDTIYGLWCSSTTPTDANFTAIMNRLFGHVAATGQTLTVTRATTATAEPKAGASPSLYAYPANILRITENGALLEAATTNLLLQSEAIDSASWTSVGTPTVTADQYAFPTGQTTMEKIVTTVAGNGRGQAATVTSSTGPFTASAWVRADTGTATESVVGQGCATVSTCTCAVSSGSCTGSIVGASCAAFATVGTTPVRIAATYTCALAVTSVTALVAPGQFNTTFGTGGFGGAQLETAGYTSSYIPTTTVAVARNADAVSVANPLPVGPFCVTGTWTPALAPLSTWTGFNRVLWSFGTTGAANSVRFTIINGLIRVQTNDATLTQKQWDSTTLTGSSATTLTFCSDNAGTGTVTLNGVSQSVTPTGVGTGVLSAMNTVQIGGDTLPVLQVAAVKNFKVCKGSNPAACQ